MPLSAFVLLPNVVKQLKATRALHVTRFCYKLDFESSEIRPFPVYFILVSIRDDKSLAATRTSTGCDINCPENLVGLG